MGTCRGNMGTVLEHVVLCTSVKWALEHSAQTEGPLRYIDTHAMAPLNTPREDPFLGNVISVAPRNAHRETNLYVKGLVASHNRKEVIDIALRQNEPPSLDYYPTHFVHAALVAQEMKKKIDGYLFENNQCASEEDRRGEISRFLEKVALQEFAGLRAAWGRATLAATGKPHVNGDFRYVENWPQADRRHGKALVVFCDPLGFVGMNPKPGQMNGDDLEKIRTLISERYLDSPDLTVNIILTRGGRDNPDINRHADYMTDVWQRAFLPPGRRRPERRCAAVGWGHFAVFVGAYVKNNHWQGDTFRSDFDKLLQECRNSLVQTAPECNAEPEIVLGDCP
jgi:hypothetical protein